MAKDRDVSRVKTLLYGLLFLFSFIFAISISTNDQTRLFLLIKSMGFFVFASIISLVIYSDKENIRLGILGIKFNNAILSLSIGIGAGILFLLAGKLLPGFSIGVPLVPNAIGDGLQRFIVEVIAPVVEEIFFAGALYVYIKRFKPTRNNKIFAILILSLLFALYHLGAYVSGIYDLPGVTQGFLSFSANISVFVAAFLFRVVASLIVLNGKIQNLLGSMAFHLVLNVFAFESFAITFALVLSLL